MRQLKLMWLMLFVFIWSIPISAQQPDGDCRLSPEQQLQVGMFVQVTAERGNKHRLYPSTDTLVIGVLPDQAIGTIIEGPVCSNGYRWWRVAANGYIGWSADGFSPEDSDSNFYWLTRTTTPIPPPEANLIAFRFSGRIEQTRPIFTVDVDTGLVYPMFICEDDCGEIVWSTDGERIGVYDELGGLQTARYDGTDRQLFNPPEYFNDDLSILPMVAWSADLSEVILSAVNVGGGQIVRGNIAGGSLNPAAEPPVYGGSFGWALDGGRVAFIQQGNLYWYSDDFSDGRQVTDDRLYQHLRVSPNGQWIAARYFPQNESGSGVRLIAAETGSIVDLPDVGGDEPNRALGWSDDSRYLAVYYIDENTQVRQTSSLYIYDVQTGQLTLATDDMIADWYDKVDWSSDNRQLAYLGISEFEPGHIALKTVDFTTGERRTILDPIGTPVLDLNFPFERQSSIAPAWQPR